MIVVRVELWSAITGERTELARMHISNVGGSAKRGDYAGKTFRGRDTRSLDRRVVQREGTVVDYPRLDLHVWHLVGRMLAGLGYGPKDQIAHAMLPGFVETDAAGP